MSKRKDRPQRDSGSRFARLAAKTQPPAQAPAPAGPDEDLLGGLARTRKETANLVLALTAHRDETEKLAHELNQHELGTLRLLRGLVDVLGSFDRLLALDDDPDVDFDSYRGSVRKTAKVLADTLWNNNIKLIGEPGELAEPETHRVVEVRHDADLPEETVLAVLQRGMRYRDRLVQPASVIVSTARADEPAQPAQQAQEQAAPPAAQQPETEPAGDGLDEEQA